MEPSFRVGGASAAAPVDGSGGGTGVGTLVLETMVGDALVLLDRRDSRSRRGVVAAPALLDRRHSRSRRRVVASASHLCGLAGCCCVCGGFEERGLSSIVSKAYTAPREGNTLYSGRYSRCLTWFLVESEERNVLCGDCGERGDVDVRTIASFPPVRAFIFFPLGMDVNGTDAVNDSDAVNGTDSLNGTESVNGADAVNVADAADASRPRDLDLAVQYLCWLEHRCRMLWRDRASSAP